MVATKTRAKAENVYDADALQKLDPIDHIRKRISMYLSDNTGEGGLSTALREILDNSQDEFLSGHGNKIVLTFFPDGSAQVQDSGRGIPTGINKQTGENGIVLALAHVGAGGKFNSANSGYGGGTGGLNGVGTTASNAVSKKFVVTVHRDNKEHTITFKEGKPGRFADPDDLNSAFTPNRDLIVTPDKRSAAEKKARPTGTTIRMYPDPTIFVPGAKFDVETIKFRLRSTAFLLPGLSIEVHDLRDPVNEVHDLYEFDGGIAEMLPTIAPDKALHDPVHFITESSFTEQASIVDNDGNMSTGDVERHVDIDVAFVWGEGYATTTKSFVNIINTESGGTHEGGFYRGLSRVLIDNIKNTRGLLKAKEEAPTLDDIKEGLTAIVSIKFPEPQFVGQAKGALGTSAITSLMSNAVFQNLKDFLNDKKNAGTAKIIYQKIVNASRVRIAQRQQKETARRKTALSSASMPAKLVDCSETGTEFTELLICEGDSALGTLKSARDSRYQALLPIRGKILNVNKASMADILANSEISDIIQVLGAGFGNSFDLEQMRINRIVICADADQDGLHIINLLTMMAVKMFRPMVEAGRLFVAVPPLYVIKTKGKNKEIIYAENDIEKDKILARLDKQRVGYEPLSRLKGLGEMDADQFWETTLNPETRTLRRIDIEDGEASQKMLDLALGKDVAPRKAWIMSSRHKIDAAYIDA